LGSTCDFSPFLVLNYTYKQVYTGPHLALAAEVETTVQSIQCTCLYLAAKVADHLHGRGLLCYMLTTLTKTTSSNDAAVTARQAALVEERCLLGLDWRLGPYFAEDVLDD
jgi:hypothetical protein